MPTVRALLRAFEYPNAAGHIYTGLEVILPLLARMSAAAAETPSKRPRRAASAQASASDVSNSRILGLIAIIMFFVLSRMMDQEITPQQFMKWREKAIEILLNTSAAKEVSEGDLSTEIDTLMPMAQEEGWIRMDWFLNVLPPSADDTEGFERTNGAPTVIRNAKRNLREGGSSYIGLGTMMQEANDFLGERQCEDYERWKVEIMARVEAIEAMQYADIVQSTATVKALDTNKRLP